MVRRTAGAFSRLKIRRRFVTSEVLQEPSKGEHFLRKAIMRLGQNRGL